MVRKEDADLLARRKILILDFLESSIQRRPFFGEI